MTKLDGTSGQLFAGLAESLNTRGASRSAKTTGAKSAEDASFHDLLHTVSNLAKRALNDHDSDATVKAGTLRMHLANLAERDEPGDETVHEDGRAGEEPKSQDKQVPLDLAAKTDVVARVNLSAIVGQELAAVPTVTPQLQPPANDKSDASAREERSLAKREIQGTSAAKATMADVDPSGPHARALAPQANSPSTAPQSSAAPPRTTSAASGFEAVTANVERAAKVAVREALPEATKVTVVQQETHLPPVPQFSATQQVADAVVSELKGAPASSAAPDLASSLGSAPDQPLKILTINLEPPALGNVTVRLRLVGAEVSVHLAAERKDTSQMLDQQRDSIRELMQSAGYIADVAPVQHGSLDGFQAGSGQSQPQLPGQQQHSSQSQGAFNGSSTSSGQSEGGAKQDRQDRQPNQETRHDQDVAPHIRRGPVYL
ncbi:MULTISPECIES: flagellar hook-length control protein FliK [unclassified Bradyrhizobium]|uniref:flagellar hook-length control protein FliK n=1 Tax=unclassified Bradyrhizobium TaxID=2631580 RepID=UPI0024784F46|nr:MULTISPECIES: flagellar hook-length control protein FliK [unclassified Bradyrhizobium]WGR70098.1 flagellar hook-length control protein FliK [Bradyrhizobium sp. ISRA426]WGR82155.1 flagellar hook-length control protein FliK [Bradyrhizobium sp. ISRA430]WGR85341.1 flagellar hook-length control protein FliK [Bradyrhizobium sp. ISRA432]